MKTPKVSVTLRIRSMLRGSPPTYRVESIRGAVIIPMSAFPGLGLKPAWVARVDDILSEEQARQLAGNPSSVEVTVHASKS